MQTQVMIRRSASVTSWVASGSPTYINCIASLAPGYKDHNLPEDNAQRALEYFDSFRTAFRYAWIQPKSSSI